MAKKNLIPVSRLQTSQHSFDSKKIKGKLCEGVRREYVQGVDPKYIHAVSNPEICYVEYDLIEAKEFQDTLTFKEFRHDTYAVVVVWENPHGQTFTMMLNYFEQMILKLHKPLHTVTGFWVKHATGKRIGIRYVGE